jgi:hypothetical protein
MSIKEKDYQALSDALRTVLINEWDPIGVRSKRAARDEYDAYIPGIIRLLQAGADHGKLTQHLQHTEVVNMGLRGDVERNGRVANKILDIYHQIRSVCYRIRLMFEWGGGCLWCNNDAARARFDVGPIEDQLPLSAQTRQRLDELREWHDQSLNWAYPPDPGPWTPKEYADFEQAAQELRAAIQAELGSAFEVVYVPL